MTTYSDLANEKALKLYAKIKKLLQRELTYGIYDAVLTPGIDGKSFMIYCVKLPEKDTNKYLFFVDCEILKNYTVKYAVVDKAHNIKYFTHIIKAFERCEEILYTEIL